MLKLIAAVWALLLASVAHGQVIDTLFALPWGKPMDRELRLCSGASSRSDYCSFDRLGPKSRATSVGVSPTFDGPNAVPAWVAAGKSFTVEVGRDGSVDRIMLYTDGLARQDEVIASISMRLGRANVSAEEVQNAYGAKWVRKTASWTHPNVHAFFHCPTLTDCLATFETPRKVQEKREEAEKRQRPKMP